MQAFKTNIHIAQVNKLNALPYFTYWMITIRSIEPTFGLLPQL